MKLGFSRKQQQLFLLPALLAFICGSFYSSWAQDGQSHVKAELLADSKAVQAGQPFKLGVALSMDPGWHTYFKESGEAGMPTKIEWQLPPGFQASDLQWQKPETFVDSGITTYGYKDYTVIAATITPPANLKAGESLDLKAKVKWLACKELCIPGSAEVALSLPVTTSTPQLDNNQAFSFAPYTGKPATSILNENVQVQGASDKPGNFLVYLALAFVGGFILNFMPCVLPVISIKVLSFVQQAGEDPKRVFNLGLTFTAGILSSFLVLAFLVIGIQQAGQKVGWGFQFQVPGFLIAMSVLVLLLALSLFGLFYISVPGGTSEIDKLATKEGHTGTFFKGVLATVLATPCTAPALGTALGFAFGQPFWVILLIFFTIGLGMAFPYLLLTAQPAWMRYIPKPGAWMETFKESMGFVLLATVVWLLWVLGKQTGVEGVIWTSCFLLVISFAAWLIGRLVDLTSSNQKKYTVWAIALVLIGLGYWCFIPQVLAPEAAASVTSGNTTSGPDANGITWQPFSIDKLDAALGSKQTVLIDFTAEWCLTCKVNEQTVINTAPVAEKLKALKVVTFRADWTKKDSVITNLLQKFGRSGVPLYVIFPAGKPTQPIVLPEVITQSMVLEKLSAAGPSQQ